MDFLPVAAVILLLQLSGVESGDSGQFDVRLVDGEQTATTLSGRVEVYYNGVWGTVCDDNWHNIDASVVCRQLGYAVAIRPITRAASTYPEGTGQIWLNNVECREGSRNLGQCAHDGWGEHRCSHREDAGAICGPATPSVPVRLVGGEETETTLSGRVEVFYNDTWGTICDDDFYSKEASVVCKQLGFITLVSIHEDAEFGEGTGPIWLNDVGCGGSEDNLGQCASKGWGVHNCEHDEDVGIVCSHKELVADCVRLVDGEMTETRVSGRVEVLFNGTWGTICDDDWDLRDATVICKQLGYAGALEATEESEPFGPGSEPTWLDGVDCGAFAENLNECFHEGWGSEDCDHDEDAGVVCGTPVRPDAGSEVCIQPSSTVTEPPPTSPCPEPEPATVTETMTTAETETVTETTTTAETETATETMTETETETETATVTSTCPEPSTVVGACPSPTPVREPEAEYIRDRQVIALKHYHDSSNLCTCTFKTISKKPCYSEDELPSILVAGEFGKLVVRCRIGTVYSVSSVRVRY